MEFLRDRGFAYAIGALEFADNIRLNVIDKLLPNHSPHHISKNADSLEGKLCIVTGGNAGIGRAFAEAAVQHGAHVILACRSMERGKRAAKAIQHQHPAKQAHVEVRELDLASLRSVRKFAQQFKGEHRRLDILVCNAGIMAPPERGLTPDGLEQQFQVNYLSHWLLAHQLLKTDCFSSSSSHRTGEKRSATEPRRLIFLSSMTHRAGHLDFSNLQLERRYTGFKGYANSKLATLLAAQEWQRRFRSCDSTRHDIAVAVHPGLVDTELARGWLTGADVTGSLLQPIVAPVARLLAPWLLISPRRAVDQLMYAATGPASKALGYSERYGRSCQTFKVAGAYIAHGTSKTPSREARDAGAARRLWSVSCQLTGVQEDTA